MCNDEKFSSTPGPGYGKVTRLFVYWAVLQKTIVVAEHSVCSHSTRVWITQNTIASFDDAELPRVRLSRNYTCNA